MTGQIVKFRVPNSDATRSGYLATATGGSGPGVILLQEWWGLVDHIKDVADRLAAAGFTVLAPDLYHGETTSNPDDAGKLFMALNIEETTETLAGAVDALLAEDACSTKQVGTVGFCMGGQLSLMAACNISSVGPCVNFYGVHPHVAPDYSGLTGPVLGFFAELDGFVDVSAVTKLMGDVAAAGKQMEVHRYLSVDHAFFNDTRPDVFNEPVATDAWHKTLTFLGAHLKR